MTDMNKDSVERLRDWLNDPSEYRIALTEMLTTNSRLQKENKELKTYKTSLISATQDIIELIYKCKAGQINFNQLFVYIQRYIKDEYREQLEYNYLLTKEERTAILRKTIDDAEAAHSLKNEVLDSLEDEVTPLDEEFANSLTLK